MALRIGDRTSGRARAAAWALAVGAGIATLAGCASSPKQETSIAGGLLVIGDARAKEPVWRPFYSADRSPGEDAAPWDRAIALKTRSGTPFWLYVVFDHEEAGRIHLTNPRTFESEARLAFERGVRRMVGQALPVDERVFRERGEASFSRVARALEELPVGSGRVVVLIRTSLGENGELYLLPRVIVPGHGEVAGMSALDGRMLEGTWRGFEALFQDAGARLGEADKVLDAVLPKPSGVLTTREHGFARRGVQQAFPTEWTVDREATETSAPIAFSFPPPHDDHAGVVTALDARLFAGRLGEGFELDLEVSAAAADATMGDEGLDETVRYSLSSDKFPRVRFRARNPVLPDKVRTATLGLGEWVFTTLEGRYDMAGVGEALDIFGAMRVFRDGEGRLRLELRAWFATRLKEPFKILGPVGKAPANDTLMYSVRVVMKPAAEAGAARDGAGVPSGMPSGGAAAGSPVP